MTLEKKTIDIIIDPTAPHAAIEEVVLAIQHCRAKTDKWTRRLHEWENKLGELLKSGTAQQNLQVDTPPATPKKRGRKGAEYPEGTTAEAILDIAERGAISAEDLVLILFEDDTRENRKRVYSRVRHWKGKGWIGKAVDGTWGVPGKIMEELEKLDD